MPKPKTAKTVWVLYHGGVMLNASPYKAPLATSAKHDPKLRIEKYTLVGKKK